MRLPPCRTGSVRSTAGARGWAALQPEARPSSCCRCGPAAGCLFACGRASDVNPLPTRFLLSQRLTCGWLPPRGGLRAALIPVRSTIGMEACGEERDCHTFNETLHAAAAGEQSVEADEG